jgi:hypothetical protein
VQAEGWQAHDGLSLRSDRLTSDDTVAARQDQAIHSLKTLLERQESLFDEKLRLVSAKYSQVKAINLALQVAC